MTNVEKLQQLGILEDVRERLGAEDGADRQPGRKNQQDDCAPDRKGVDPQRFMDEVRGRVPFEEALRLLRDLTDLQNGPPLETYREQWENTMVEIQDFLNAHEV